MKTSECFAYDCGECKILTVTKCQGESCRFMKTKEDVRKSERKALKRIKSLDTRITSGIIKNYFGGDSSILDDI